MIEYYCLKRLFLVFAVLSIFLIPTICRSRERRVRTTVDVDEPRYDMKTVRNKIKKNLPRQDIIDILRRGKYFQDIFTEHSEPLKIQFGHVCENPHEWEQRFERKDLENNKHQGKVRWGNKNAEYGEHYWDLNHGK